MFLDFTFVQWAIIIGALVSTVTLLVVILDIYWSHIATKRSDISVRASNSRDASTSASSTRNTIRSPCTLVNEGERSGVVRAQEIDIQFDPSGDSFGWSDLQETSDHQSAVVSIDHLDNRSVRAHSTAEASIKFNPRDIEAVNSRILNQDSIEIQAQIHVEDNEGHYEIEYLDEIALT